MLGLLNEEYGLSLLCMNIVMKSANWILLINWLAFT